MTQQRSHLVALPSLLSNAAALHTAFLIFCYPRAPLGDLTGLLVWWGCLTLTYFALALYLRSERPLQGVMAIAIIGFILQFLLTLLLGGGYPKILNWIFLMCAWAGMSYRCCDLLLHPAKPETLVLSLEGAVAALFVAAFFVAGGVMAPVVLASAALGVLLALLALTSLRCAHARSGSISGQGWKGRLLLLALLFAFFLAAAAAAALFTVPAAAGFTQVTQWLKQTGLALFQAMETFLHFLASLFPEEEAGPYDPLETGGTATLQGGGNSGGSINGEAVVYIIAGLILGVVLLVLLFHLRRGGKTRRVAALPGRKKQRRRGMPLGALLSLFWRRLVKKLRFQAAYWRGRNTAPGLLVWLERNFHRRGGESSRAFLERVGRRVPSCAPALNDLADCLDAHYFGAGASMPAADIAALRRRMIQEQKKART